MCRKDVSSFVPLYDFMSQIIDYGNPELEKCWKAFRVTTSGWGYRRRG